MFARRLWGALIVSVLAVAPLSAQTTRLEQIYNRMHPGPKFPGPLKLSLNQNPSNQEAGTWNNLSGVDGKAVVALGVGVGMIATAPLWIPALIWDKENLDFSKYPNAHPGEYMVPFRSCNSDDFADDYWENERITKGWASRVSLDTGSNFDGLNRLGGTLFLDTNFYRLGFLANVNWFREQNPFGKDPSALMSDFNLTYRVTQCEWLQLHVGLGGRAWSSLGDNSGGINAFYRGDLFPFRPVNLSAIYEIGNLDQSLFMHFRTQLGANWGHGEFFIGYDWIRLAGVTLQGPLVGLRLWF